MSCAGYTIWALFGWVLVTTCSAVNNLKIMIAWSYFRPSMCFCLHGGDSVTDLVFPEEPFGPLGHTKGFSGNMLYRMGDNSWYLRKMGMVGWLYCYMAIS